MKSASRQAILQVQVQTYKGGDQTMAKDSQQLVAPVLRPLKHSAGKETTQNLNLKPFAFKITASGKFYNIQNYSSR